MSNEEQMRLYQLIEKLNWFFHQRMHYLDAETAEKTHQWRRSLTQSLVQASHCWGVSQQLHEGSNDWAHWWNPRKLDIGLFQVRQSNHYWKWRISGFIRQDWWVYFICRLFAFWKRAKTFNHGVEGAKIFLSRIHIEPRRFHRLGIIRRNFEIGPRKSPCSVAVLS